MMSYNNIIVSDVIINDVIGTALLMMSSSLIMSLLMMSSSLIMSLLMMSLVFRLVKVWDYQNKACVQTLEGHAQNVTAVSFHSELPILMTGSEDGMECNHPS